MGAYYNEYDPKAAAWLRELIRRGLIADGVVDERSILDVQPGDLRGLTQCHFFAGIGGWSYALRLAGWPDDRPVWTGSPPCQPFSAAGQQKGKDDERHLAPHFAALVAACRPPVLFGEQVASSAVFGKAAKRAGGAADGAPEWAWLDDLCGRLEAAHYAVGASDIPAAGVGAPHIRQRTFFGAVRLADADGGNASAEGVQCGGEHRQQQADGGVGGMADAAGNARQKVGAGDDAVDQQWSEVGGRTEQPAGTGADGRDRGGDHRAGGGEVGPSRDMADVDRPRPSDSFWSDADWLFCRDGKWRPVEPGTFPLANGVSARVGRLRGYGNAIVPQVAATFIEAMMDVI